VAIYITISFRAKAGGLLLRLLKIKIYIFCEGRSPFPENNVCFQKFNSFLRKKNILKAEIEIKNLQHFRIFIFEIINEHLVKMYKKKNVTYRSLIHNGYSA
jgi:hypothetical protein